MQVVLYNGRKTVLAVCVRRSFARDQEWGNTMGNTKPQHGNTKVVYQRTTARPGKKVAGPLRTRNSMCTNLAGAEMHNFFCGGVLSSKENSCRRASSVDGLLLLRGLKK